MLRAVVINLATLALIMFTLGISIEDDQISASYPNYGGQVRRQSADIITFPTSSEMKNNYQTFHHHHHYHDPNFHHDPDFHHHHHQHNHPDDQGGNKDDSSKKNSIGNRYDNSSEIPLNLIWKLNNFTNLNDLLLNMVDGDVEEEHFLASRFGDGERSAAVTPKAAGCMPELQTVKIVPDDDPSVLYIPSCTRVERCGGCCSHSLLSCRPTDIETINFQVVKTQFTGGSKFKFVGKEVIPVEKHTKCKCDCKIQEKDCTSFQEYRKSQCRCACMNIDEEKKCLKENSTKLWNSDLCTCQCRNIVECSTGYRFDNLRCKCGPISVRRRFAELKDTELETEPVVENTET